MTLHDLVLIQCTKAKRDGTHEARDLYDKSSTFRKARKYAESTNKPYRILSAKHGLVHPEDTISYYDDFGVSEAWARRVTDDVSGLLDGSSTVIMLAGRKYSDVLTPEIESRIGADVVEPLRGLRNGPRMNKIDEMRRRETNESLV